MPDSGKLIAAGFSTSALTAYLIALIELATGLKALSFSIFFIIPVGAIICGFMAASGYYLMSKKLDVMPDLNLLVQMIIVAASAVFLVFWFEYHGAFFPGASLSDEISFLQFVNYSITEAHYIGGGSHGAPAYESGALGGMGYLLFMVQFGGFCFGAIAVFRGLQNAPKCADCQKYLKSKHLKKETFESPGDCLEYMNELFEHHFETSQFAELFKKVRNVRKHITGQVSLESTLLSCNSCKAHWLLEVATVYEDGDRFEIPELTRCNQVPSSVDLSLLMTK